MNFLVLQHVSVEHPGSFRDLWRSADITWTTIDFERGDALPDNVSQYDAMIVMGGPMDVWQTSEYDWLLPEIELIRHFVVELNKPYLGICLGHQLLARAIGADVGPAASSEVGVMDVELSAAAAEDMLVGDSPNPMTVFQWHSAEVKNLPSGAELLASSEKCAIQSFRFGEFAYGLQFHAELTERTVDEWSEIAEYKLSLEEIFGAGGVGTLKKQVDQSLPGFLKTAERLSENFLSIVDRNRSHSSRPFL